MFFKMIRKMFGGRIRILRYHFPTILQTTPKDLKFFLAQGNERSTLSGLSQLRI